MAMPPRALRWLVSRLLPRRDREWMLDDLDEDFARRARRRHFWYVAQAVHLRVSHVGRPFRGAALARLTSLRQGYGGPPKLHGHMLSTYWQDVRYAGRTLRKQPGFTIVAVLSLAAGIGLNSTIFTLVDALLFRPLPYANASELVSVYTSDERAEPFGSTSYPDLLDWRAADLPFDGLVGHSMMFAAIGVSGQNRLAFGEVVTANYFDVLGVPLARGRGFRPDEELREGAAPVTVISDRLWRRDFVGRHDIVGQTIFIRNRSYTVVGVTMPAFNGTMAGLVSDLWVPVSMVGDVEPAGQIDFVPSAGDTRLQQRGSRWLFVKGRLRDDVPLAAASEQLRGLMAGLEQAHPESNRARRAVLAPAGSVRFHPDLDRIIKPASLVLLASVCLVLVVACANLAGMLLARGAARTREMALRSALGAGRGRLIRQLAIESLVLSALGGVSGLMLSAWATSALVSMSLPMDIPVSLALPTDWRLLAFTGGLTLLTGLAFGILPALRASRPNLVPALKDEGALGTPGRRFGLRQGLVVTQVAVSVVLLVGGLLLTRSLMKALDTDPGFTAGGLVTATISLDLHGYEDTRGQQFFERAMTSARQLPGVQSVAVADRLPLSPNFHTTSVVFDGRPEATPPQGLTVDTNSVTHDFFDTLGVPLIAGRNFDTRDTPDSTRAAIVSEAFAAKYFPAGAVGGRLRMRSQEGQPVEIIGVTRDYNVRSVAEAPRPAVHFSRMQRPSSAGSLIIRTASDPAQTVLGLERALRAMEPQLVFLELGPLDRLIATSLLPVSLGAALFGGLAGLAMLLAGLGLYGVIAFSVARRSREIGIRMALGSTRTRVLRQILREALVLVSIGTVAGAVLAATGTQALSGVLVGVTASDPVSYAIAIALLAVTGTLAAVIPARRAASVDPLVALRSN